MKTMLTAVVMAFAIISGVFSIVLPVQAQSNTTDNTAKGMSMGMGGDVMRMLHESSTNHK